MDQPHIIMIEKMSAAAGCGGYLFSSVQKFSTSVMALLMMTGGSDMQTRMPTGKQVTIRLYRLPALVA